MKKRPTAADFSEKEIRLSRIAKSLGHPARIRILRLLASKGTCCFTDISRELPLAASTVTQHLEELKNSGLITGNFEPPNVNYVIDQDCWKKARKNLRKFMNVDLD